MKKFVCTIPFNKDRAQNHFEQELVQERIVGLADNYSRFTAGKGLVLH